LGYFRLEAFAELSQKQVYWLSRLYGQTQVYDQAGQPIDLEGFLQGRDEIDIPVFLGSSRVAARLIAWRVPESAAQQRQRSLRADAQRRGRPISARRWGLTPWTVLVTNAPDSLLTAAEAVVLYRVRWQIELLFKLWKSQGLLDESRSIQPWRQLTEVFAKMLALLIAHWVLVVSCWSYPDRSLFQAIKTVQRYATGLALALARRHHLIRLLEQLHDNLAVGCRITRRRKAPSTYQLLGEVSR
jgi:hypothetical protein